jgi:hypothetical protein
MTSLPNLAAEMKHDAAANLNTPIRRHLRGGLRLVLVDTIQQHRLSLVRLNAPPSTKTVEIIRRDFDVPKTARLEEAKSTVGGQVFYIVRLIWPRGGQMTMLADEGDKVIIKL